MVKKIYSFCSNDPFWEETLGFLQQRVKSNESVIAPDEFAQFIQADTPSRSNVMIPRLYDWIVIHKGQLSHYNLNFLRIVEDTHVPIFCNEVFVIFTMQKIKMKLWRFIDKFSNSTKLENVHVIAFREKLSSLLSSLVNIDSSQKSRISNLIHNSQDIASMSLQNFEIICRENTFSTYIGKNIILCRVLAKYFLYADSQDVGISPHLFANGYWEAWMTIAMAKTLKPGWSCIDVGANHGYYTLLMAGIVGSSGRVIAIEPNPKLATLLQQTITLNGLQTWTKILTDAAFETPNETLNFYIPDKFGMNATLVDGSDSISSGTLLQVKSTTIDQITKEWKKVDFIKIDAEGGEEFIWKGMNLTLENNPDITIILEFNAGRYANPRSFLELIQSKGFVLRHIDFDTVIKDLTIEQCLSNRINEDWLLFLKR